MAEDQNDDSEEDEPPATVKGNGTAKQPNKAATNKQVETLQVKNLKADIRNKNWLLVLVIVLVMCLCCLMITVGLQFGLREFNSVVAGVTGPY